MSKQIRIWLGAAGAALLFTAVTAWGQEAGGSAYTTSPQAAGEPDRSSQSSLPIGALVQRSGGSLLRAEMSNQPQGGFLTPSSVSYYDVPEPKPKLLRKHDLVTIVIRENSEFES